MVCFSEKSTFFILEKVNDKTMFSKSKGFISSDQKQNKLRIIIQAIVLVRCCITAKSTSISKATEKKILNYFYGQLSKTKVYRKNINIKQATVELKSNKV